MAGDFDDSDTDEPGRFAGTRLQALISVNGLTTSKLLPVTGEVTIGRSSSCDLTIRNASVSRHHVTLKMSPLEVIDHGSRNGTSVAGRRIASGTPTALEAGDSIQLGEANILIQLVTPAELDHHAPPLDAACALAAHTGEPFAVAMVNTDNAAAATAALDVIRKTLSGVEAMKSDTVGGLQLVLADSTAERASAAIARVDAALRAAGIRARFGVARYPEDGVVAEQLIAFAYEQLDRPPGVASAMDAVREMIDQLAEGELSVLLTGETGVGKELCAEMIHRLSPRATGPFIKFNCSALVESLIESELFGHERGAFTGAVTAQPGLLESGEGGTVFLDEIGELPLGVQAKLLRVIEERIVRRVGATAGKKIDVRFVYATNRDLLEEVDAGRFRRDLYYRLNGMTIFIPPLRERRGEILPLARAFASRVRPGAPIALGAEVIAALEQHTWPGNVRELRNTIERAVLLSSGGAVRPSHLVLASSRDSNLRDSQNTLPISRASESTIDAPSRRSESLAEEVAELERRKIMEALDSHGGNQTQVARALGMSRGTLIARMEQYGLRRPRKRDD